MIDWHRRRKETHSIDESGIAKHDDPTQPMLDQERMQALKDCMESLSEREASVVRRLLAGESYQQICRRLEVNSNVAYKTARIAKTKLRTCVEHKLA